MKNFEEIKKNCLLFSDICGAYELACKAVEKEYRRDAERLIYRSNVELCGIGSELAQIKSECENEKAARSECARRYLADAREIVDGICDNHFQRVKSRILAENYEATYLPSDFKSMNFDALRALIENSCDKLKKAANELDNAFVPAAVSGVVGFFVPSFHKKLHSEIVIRHADIVRLAAVLDNFSLVKSTEKNATAAEEALRRRITEYASEHAALLKKKRDATLEKRRMTFKKVLEADNMKRIFAETDGKYCFGKFYYFSKCIGDVSDSLSGCAKAIESGGISFPVFAESLENLLLVSDGETRFKNWFISLVLDVIENNKMARVRLFDLAGLGSTYSVLTPLLDNADIAVASTAAEASQFLSETEKYIADVNMGKSTVTDTYLFIENIPENISDRDADLLLKIIKNGEKCGVHVIGTLADGAEYGRAYSGFIKELCRTKKLISVQKCRIRIGGGYLYLAVRGSTSERVEKLTERLAAFKKTCSKIPIRKTFPTEDGFQKCSSADEIRVPIGVHHGGETVELVFSENRPYALAVGDVSSGKSSVLHAALLGIMARYSPREVRFAVGDFKNGCEFTSYAEGECPYFEAVVSSEDTDTMASFLRYYVSIMNSRQREFDEVSEKGGANVRKYETYRSECERLGIEYLPRILLMIDEFQTLFDNASSGTGTLLGELVRKGRTYGVHIIMASQRAVSDSLKSSFGTELKNYFTTRIVFKCPQQVARTMLSERCADTGRENSGIAKAPLLESGHAVFNTYMGQNEEGTSVIQCFYADGVVIADAIELFTSVGKKKYVEILKDGYTHLPYEDIVGYVMLGKSARLFCDSAAGHGDCICDDSCVALDAAKLRDSILVCGDIRLVKAVFTSALKCFIDAKVNICSAESGTARYFSKKLCPNANVVDSVSQLDIPDGEGVTVNLILSPERDASLHQSSGYRSVPAAEHFKGILQSAETGRVINIVFCSDYRAARNSMPYLADLAPLRFISDGNGDNIRAALGEISVTVQDKPFTEAGGIMNAYYCNKKTGKSGKFFTFSEDILPR